MARKTPIRQLANHLPWQVQKAIELETKHEAGATTWADKDDEGAVVIEGEILEPETESDAGKEAKENAASEGGKVQGV